MYKNPNKKTEQWQKATQSIDKCIARHEKSLRDMAYLPISINEMNGLMEAMEELTKSGGKVPYDAQWFLDRMFKKYKEITTHKVDELLKEGF